MSRNFNLTTFVLFCLCGLLLALLAAFIWMAATGDSFSKSLYWSIQTATTVGYGAGFNGWGSVEYSLCVVWMFLSVSYWSSLAAVVVAKVGEFFDR